MKKKYIGIGVVVIVLALAVVLIAGVGGNKNEEPASSQDVAQQEQPEMPEEYIEEQEQHQKELAEKAKEDAKEDAENPVEDGEQIVWFCSTEYGGYPTNEWITFLSDGTYLMKIQNVGHEPAYETGIYGYLDDEHKKIEIERNGEVFQGEISGKKLELMDKTYKATHDEM